MEGQEGSPNPVELFWEKNRRVILGAVAVFVIGVGIYYALQYMKRQELDRLGSLAMVGPRLDAAYANPDVPELNQGALNQIVNSLVANLATDLSKASDEDLEAAILGLEGSPQLPSMLWAAGRAYYQKAVASQGADRNAYFDKATQSLQRLQKEFPKSEFVAESKFPVQVRQPVETEDDAQPPAGQDPELEEPAPGSPVGRLLEQIAVQRKFFDEHQSRFFEAKRPPEGSPEVEIDFEGYGKVTFVLYRNAAPKHVDAFLQWVHEGFYDGQRVYELVRNLPQFRQYNFQPEEIKFGIPSTREDDRTKWETTSKTPEDAQLEFEVTEAAKELSHFPGVLTAADEGEKSSSQRFGILTTDGSSPADGERVIVGIVKDDEGMSVLNDIIEAPLSTEAETNAARGKPATNITITSAKVTVPGGWEPKPEAPEDPPKDPPGEGNGK